MLKKLAVAIVVVGVIVGVAALVLRALAEEPEY